MSQEELQVASELQLPTVYISWQFPNVLGRELELGLGSRKIN